MRIRSGIGELGTPRSAPRQALPATSFRARKKSLCKIAPEVEYLYYTVHDAG